MLYVLGARPRNNQKTRVRRALFILTPPPSSTPSLPTPTHTPESETRTCAERVHGERRGETRNRESHGNTEINRKKQTN